MTKDTTSQAEFVRSREARAREVLIECIRTDDGQGDRWDVDNTVAIRAMLAFADEQAAAPPQAIEGSAGEAKRASDIVDELPCQRFGSFAIRHYRYSTVVAAVERALATRSPIGEREREQIARARETGQFLLDRLVDHEVRMTSDDDAREWHGHVAPAMERFRAALATPVIGEGGK